MVEVAIKPGARRTDPDEYAMLLSMLPLVIREITEDWAEFTSYEVRAKLLPSDVLSDDKPYDYYITIKTGMRLDARSGLGGYSAVIAHAINDWFDAHPFEHRPSFKLIVEPDDSFTFDMVPGRLPIQTWPPEEPDYPAFIKDGLPGRVQAGKISMRECLIQIWQTLQIRIQFMIVVAVMIGGYFRGFTAGDYRWAVLALTLGVSFEITNTALERTFDGVMRMFSINPRKPNQHVKYAKDAAAAAVSPTALFSVFLIISLFIWP